MSRKEYTQLFDGTQSVVTAVLQSCFGFYFFLKLCSGSERFSTSMGL